MQNKFPTVSIILPVYNGAAHIADALESVQQQTFNQWECIVIDDGSTDETRQVVVQYEDERIKYYKNDTNVGIQKTLNKGLSLAQGTYIARIDADDIWSDTQKLQTQVSCMDEHPDYVLVGTGAILRDQQGEELTRYLVPEDDHSIRQKILRKNCFVHAAVLFRRESVQQVGFYSENKKHRHVEDHELWLRLGTVGTLANIPAYMTTLTISDQSITATHRVVQAKRMLALCMVWRKKYPFFLIGYIVCLLRLSFFVIVSIIPFPRSLLYTLQSISRKA